MKKQYIKSAAISILCFLFLSSVIQIKLYGQCGTFFIVSSSSGCSTSAVTVVAEYMGPMDGYINGEFKWYDSEVGGNLKKEFSIGTEYNRYKSEYTINNPVANPNIWVSYYDQTTGCESNRRLHTADVPPPPPMISQQYATICGDGIGRIQMQSSVSNTSYQFFKQVGSTQQYLGSSSSGYFELTDFYGQDADKYYVSGSVGSACTTTSGSVNIIFEQPPNGGTTKSVNTNLSTNTVHGKNIGATKLEGYNGTVIQWLYSLSSAIGPYTSWGQAGLTTTSATSIEDPGFVPGKTVWIRALIRKGTCPDVHSSATSYYWQPNPIIVNAGPNQFSTGSATFNGSATGGDGGIQSYYWTKESGPPLSFSGSNGQVLNISASGYTGEYVFRLTATDAYGGTGYDLVTLKVVNFTMSQHAPSGPVCTSQSITLKAMFFKPEAQYPATVDGEFWWYDVDPNVPPGHSPVEPVWRQWVSTEGGDEGNISYYSFTPANGVPTTRWVLYHDNDYKKNTEAYSYGPITVSASPLVQQEYARMCGDGIGRIQFRSNSATTVFYLRKLIHTGSGISYENRGSNTSGFFTIGDFYGQDEYEVGASEPGCTAGGFTLVRFADKGVTKSVITGESDNIVHAKTFGPTRIEGHDGTILRWEYSTDDVNYINWGQEGLTTTNQTVEIEAPGKTVYIRALVSNSSCTLYSTTTSYYWEPTPVIVNAGPDQFSTGSATFIGSATGGDGGIQSYHWTKRSGPLEFDVVNGPVLNISASGYTTEYVFRLTATDAYGGTGYDDVTLKIVNFTMSQHAPSGPVCTSQSITLKAMFFKPEAQYPATVDGEFWWYDVDPNVPPGYPPVEPVWKEWVSTEGGDEGNISYYSFTPPDGIPTTRWVLYHDNNFKKNTESHTYGPITVSASPLVQQEYARMCRDGIGRIQLTSNSPSTVFYLRKLVYTNEGIEYETPVPSTDGSFTISDFYGQDEYEVGASADSGCPAAGFTAVNFDIQLDLNPPQVSGVKQICINTGTTLTASGGNGIFKWYDSNGTNIGNNAELVISDNLAPGDHTYIVERVSPQGCISASGQPVVSVYIPPVNPAISPIGPFCEFEPLTLSAHQTENVADYVWYDNAGTQLTQGLQYNAGIKPLGSHNYKYEAVDKIGCKSGVQTPVTINVIASSVCDERLNTIETITYVPNGTSPDNTKIVSNSKSYFDEAGQLLQSQSKLLTLDKVLITQPLRDKYDRVAVSTLPAPSNTSNFLYKYLFVSNTSGTKYNSVNFNEAINITTPGTLGWYYSANNTWEDHVPVTGYPYSRTDFYDDGTGEVRRTASPGDQHRLGAGHEVLSGTFPVFGELNDYISRRTIAIPGIIQDGNLVNEGVQSVIRDENGKYSISISDKSGKTVMTARPGTNADNVLTVMNTITSSSDPASPDYRVMTYFYILHDQPVTITGSTAFVVENIVTNERKPKGQTFAGAGGNWPAGFYRILLPDPETTIQVSYTNYFLDVAYQFHDDAGRLVSSVSPNGYKAWKAGTAYSIIDKTTYKYNHQGWLLTLTEPDAGTTNYIYRKDGKIRFSQNAEQALHGRFSYTHYDRLGRPVESGEYIGDDVEFVAMTSSTYNTSAIRNLVEKRFDEISWSNSLKKDWVKTHYDLPQPLPTHVDNGLSQNFVRGAVSATENINNKTWYSYDEMGRVIWVAQKPAALPRAFVTKYTYDFLGNILTVENTSFNTAGDPVTSFFHHYEYDADQRLSKVYTSPDGSTKSLRATYHYYLHGPLKRIELGDKIQGIDFVYNINGWLTHINHPDGGEFDPGKDGVAGSTNSEFKPDVFGMVLDYYESDLTSLFTTSSVNPHRRMHHLPEGSEEALAWHQPLPRIMEEPVSMMGLKEYSAENSRYRYMIQQWKDQSQK